MPHLDAAALVADPDGTAFLHAVIDVPAGMQPTRGAFDPARMAPSSWFVQSRPKMRKRRARRAVEMA